MTASNANPQKGRGAAIRPANRFESVQAEADFEHFETADENPHAHRTPTQFLPDESESIVSENDSPDIPFRYSVNPYRGCEHGCAYCYARPTHEYLGFDAGVGFETKILVKHRAPDLLRERLSRDDWQPEVIVFSGVTDCYQPAERNFALTRACLEVALEARQPISIVTKNALVTRDIDILAELAKRNLASVALSVTTLDESLARSLEPRTSAPAARLRAISELTAAGVPAFVMTAPIIPGLNDTAIPTLLKAASEAGALGANYTLLRLPLAVRPVFLEWLARIQPSLRERVESRIQHTRDGRWNDAQFGSRMRGEGEIAEQIRRTFDVFARRYNLARKREPLDTTQFVPPKPASGQLRLF